MEERNTLIHVYCMPGMGAGPEIFDYIKLPEQRFQMHLLSWKIPQKNESIVHYAKRMCEEIKHENPVLIGVSLGGLIVQEMCSFIANAKVIIISSVKTKYELPRRMHFTRMSKLYWFFPTGAIKHMQKLKHLPLGHFTKKRLALYEKYMAIEDKDYFRWAIRTVISWEREKVAENTVHIHGEKDIVFPIKYISDCTVVPKGTHVMIVNKYRWFNRYLPSIIEKAKPIN